MFARYIKVKPVYYPPDFATMPQARRRELPSEAGEALLMAAGLSGAEKEP
jgi:hypothetical protein